ncbi:hypothetical protein KXD40_004632 [Peronospora effusa]|nr:hypothetical protein KXD40_004632 [Peronospora effusa]
MKRPAEKFDLNSIPLEGMSITSNTYEGPAEKIDLNSIPLEGMSDTSNTYEANDAQLLNMETKEGEKPKMPFIDVMSLFKKEDWATIFKEANKYFFKNHIDPEDFAGDTLFEQPQLVYWVEYMDDFSKGNMPV